MPDPKFLVGVVRAEEANIVYSITNLNQVNTRCIQLHPHITLNAPIENFFTGGIKDFALERTNAAAGCGAKLDEYFATYGHYPWGVYIDQDRIKPHKSFVDYAQNDWNSATPEPSTLTWWDFTNYTYEQNAEQVDKWYTAMVLGCKDAIAARPGCNTKVSCWGFGWHKNILEGNVPDLTQQYAGKNIITHLDYWMTGDYVEDWWNSNVYPDSDIFLTLLNMYQYLNSLCDSLGIPFYACHRWTKPDTPSEQPTPGQYQIMFDAAKLSNSNIILWEGMPNFGEVTYEQRVTTGWGYYLSTFGGTSAVSLKNTHRERIKLTVSSSMVSGTVTDFPLFVTDHALDTTTKDRIVATAKSNLADIRVSTDEQGFNSLPIDILPTSAITGSDLRLDMIVRVPSLSPFADTQLYLWWNSPSAVMPNGTAAYDSNFYAMLPQGGPDINRVTGLSLGTAHNDLVVGAGTDPWGRAGSTHFDGSNDYFDLGNWPYPNQDPWTIMYGLSLDPGSLSGNMMLLKINAGTESTNTIGFLARGSTDMIRLDTSIYDNDSSTQLFESVASPANDRWMTIAHTFEGTTSAHYRAIRVLQDGAEDFDSTGFGGSSVMDHGNGLLQVGTNDPGVNQWMLNGRTIFYMIHNTVRSDDWIKTWHRSYLQGLVMTASEYVLLPSTRRTNATLFTNIIYGKDRRI